eukprot:7031679-Prymnesium_polylepis.1
MRSHRAAVRRQRVAERDRAAGRTRDAAKAKRVAAARDARRPPHGARHADHAAVVAAVAAAVVGGAVGGILTLVLARPIVRQLRPREVARGRAHGVGVEEPKMAVVLARAAHRARLEHVVADLVLAAAAERPTRHARASLQPLPLALLDRRRRDVGRVERFAGVGDEGHAHRARGQLALARDALQLVHDRRGRAAAASAVALV